MATLAEHCEVQVSCKQVQSKNGIYQLSRVMTYKILIDDDDAFQIAL